MRSHRNCAAGLTLVVLLIGCASGHNFRDPAGPRFSGAYANAPVQARFRVVTFNVKFARRMKEAGELLRDHPALNVADVVLMQEADAAGTDAVARLLQMNYVYFPAALHPANRSYFGNAILSRWPIHSDSKLILPYPGRFRNIQRIAVAATVEWGSMPVRVYSAHFETPISIEEPERTQQLETVLRDSAAYDRVLVGGDFNNRNISGARFEAKGFQWVTKHVGQTIRPFSWDHIFVRGLGSSECLKTGSVDPRGASDHRAVWADLCP